jgi:hypothetical protein
MSNQIKFIAFSLTMLTLLSVYPQPASAYLDPSTGSFAIQGAMGSVFAIMFYSRTVWNRIRSYRSLASIKCFSKQAGQH